jgi:hypothetical protein
VALPREIGYIRRIIFEDQREVWEFKGTALQGVLFHLTGFGGSRMLGAPGWLLAFAGVIAVAFLIQCAGARRVYALTWLGVLAGAYLPPALNHFKHPHFATCFDFLLVFASVAALACVVRTTPDRFRLMPRVILAATTIACLATFSWTYPRFSSADEPMVEARSRAATEVYAVVRSLAAQTPRAATIAGPLGQINHHLFTLWSIRDGVSLRTGLLRKDVSDEEFARRSKDVDIIVASEGDTGMVSDLHAEPGIADHITATIRVSGQWRSIAHVPVDGTSGSFEVFVRTDAAQ